MRRRGGAQGTRTRKNFIPPGLTVILNTNEQARHIEIIVRGGSVGRNYALFENHIDDDVPDMFDISLYGSERESRRSQWEIFEIQEEDLEDEIENIMGDIRAKYEERRRSDATNTKKKKKSN